MTDQLKVRPFDRSFDSVKGGQTRCSGVDSERGFVLRIGESQFDLEGELGVDERGPYVLLNPINEDCGFGFTLTVERSFEEGEEPGTCISLREIDPTMAQLQRQLPNMHVLSQHKGSLSLYFTSDGTLDGSGGYPPGGQSKDTATH